MPGYKDWIDAIDIKVDYFSAFIKFGLPLMRGIILAVKSREK